MLSQKIAQSTWRSCNNQPIRSTTRQNGVNNYQETMTIKDFSWKKALFSIVMAFFIVVVIAGLLNFVAQAREKSDDNVALINKLLGISTVYASDYNTLYRAEKILRSDSRTNGAIMMAPGSETNFTIGFKNIGSADWYLAGSDFVSIYTASPNYRDSKFIHPDWYKSNQPTLIKSTLVKPGQLGFFSFKLKAPNKIGEYTEYFRIAIEDTAWMRLGVFKIKIIVDGSVQMPISQSITPTIMPTVTTTNHATTELMPVSDSQVTTETVATEQIFNSAQSGGVIVDRAKPFIQSAQSIEFQNNQPIIFQIGYKNIGLNNWSNAGNEAVQIKVLDNTTKNFYDNSWIADNRPAIMATKEVQPGQLGFFKFKLRPGQQSGDFTLNFVLTCGADKKITGSQFSLPVTVLPGAVTTAYTTGASNATTISLGEPTIRVGLYKLEEPAQIRANGPYEIKDNTGKLLATLSGSQIAVVSYQDGQYQVVANGTTFITNYPVRFEAQNGLAGVLEIINYEKRPKWNLTLNDNKFRNILEINYSTANSKTWVINELPMEYYLKGLAESSNISHIEYQKALMIAARSYAFYQYQDGKKHADRNFTVDDDWDQVYRGYGAEIRLPKVNQAVEATRGMMITYNNELVVTPYFAQSNGRTKHYTEVWGGPIKPWLVSVTVPQDVNNALWGHGVGMSCRASINMANEGMNYQDILKYFYRGTGLKKIY